MENQIKNYYLKPSKLFRNKNSLGRLTLRRSLMQYPYYKRILLQLINSGTKLTTLEKQLSKEYIGGVL